MHIESLEETRNYAIQESRVIMSVHDQAAAAVISQVALAADGAVLGLALAFVAVRSIIKFTTASSALRKIRNAPSVDVSDLPDLLSSSEDGGGELCDQSELLIVRGNVESTSVVDGSWHRSLKSSVLTYNNEEGVILQRTQTAIYTEWRGFFGWTSDLRSIFGRSWKEQESYSLRTVPFVLMDEGKSRLSDYVVVNMEGSKHPLPLTTIYHNLQPVSASTYTFLQALFGHEYPIGLLDEVKILPVRKVITAVGTCSLKDGYPTIKSCQDIPYFLSELTKEQMVAELAFKTNVLLWSGVVLGSAALAVLGYAVVRNWNRWTEWKQRRQLEEQNAADSNEGETDGADGETGDVPEGELCVICLTRRRRSAFVPCGHRVCCQRCALSVERDSSPQCPVCRQPINNSIRIYDS